MQGFQNPEQPPSGPLCARESDATRESGAQDTRGPENAPEGPSRASSVAEFREHVTAIHLMGLQLDKMRDQLDEIENWFWHRLADAREQQTAVSEEAAAPAADGTCTATIHDPYRNETFRCAQPAGHYDETREPAFDKDTDDPGGWHWVPTDDGRRVWADRAEGATPDDPKDQP